MPFRALLSPPLAVPSLPAHLTPADTRTFDVLSPAALVEEQRAAARASGTRLEHVAVKGDDDALLGAFHVLVENGEIEAAASILPVIQGSMSGDALAINNFAWGVIESEPDPALAGVLLPMIEHASELTDDGDWYVLDTKAHVLFAAGRVQDAIQTAKRAVAVARVRKDERASEAEAALARFQKEAMRQRACRGSRGGEPRH